MTHHRMDVSVPLNQSLKIKETQKTDKYLDLAWELKKLKHEGDSSITCT